jgi:uncharacterized protein (UPF0548 family)
MQRNQRRHAVIESVTGRVDLAAALAALAKRSVNYDESDGPTTHHPGNWHVDYVRALVAHERPGVPVPDGAWEVACALVRDYEFSDPRIVRAVFDPGDELLGRNMLLEGRFWGPRFYMGVRVTEVIDTSHRQQRVWGWGYQTLQGHLEQGRLIYEVVKDMCTGDVALVLRAYSRRAPVANPMVRLGFDVFGRGAQLRFYTRVGRRLRDGVQAILHGAPAPIPSHTREGLVVAPSGIGTQPLERLSLNAHHPGA